MFLTKINEGVPKNIFQKIHLYDSKSKRVPIYN